MNNQLNLEAAIFAIVEAGKKIKLKWDCGGDEAIIYITIDNENLKYDNIFAQELDLYMINYLNLPDVGEFAMEGSGEIVKEAEELYVIYESILKGYEDYESEEGGWKEINERDETYSGKKKLFE